MPRFQWSNDLAIGVAQVDEQHKELVKRVGGLLDALARGQGRAEVGEMLRFLSSYVNTHFADEEKLMLRIKYPGLAEQRAQHAAFVRELQALEKQFDSQGPNSALAIAVQHKAADWLVNHIGQCDRQIGVFMAAQAQH